MALPVRRPHRMLPYHSAPAGAVLAAERPSAWLEREMAAENQVERYQFPTTGPFREDPHPSRILRTRSERNHQLGGLYTEMLEKDADLAAFAAKRADAVLALPHDRIIPADSSPAARERADFCRAWLKQASSKVQGMLYHLVHNRSTHGTAIVELIWERMSRGPLQGAWAVVDLLERPMHRFLFRDGELYVRRPLGQEPVLAPPGKFMVLRGGGSNTRGWGRSLSDFVYWQWFIKKHGWKFYAVFIEKFAQPTAVGHYRYRQQTFAAGGDDISKANQDEQNKMLAILGSLQNDVSLALPEGVDIKFLEATRSASSDYGTFIAMCTRSEALVYLGEINTSGLRPGTGSYASDQVADDVRFEKVVFDANDAMGVVKNDLFAPMIAINFGDDSLVPTLQIETLAGADLEQRREGIRLLWSAGRPVLTHHLYQAAQAEETQEGDDVTLPPAGLGQPGGSAAGDGAPPSGAAVAAAGPSFTFGEGRLSLLAAGERDDAIATAEQRDQALVDVVAAFKPYTVDYYTRHRELVEQAWDDGRFASGDALRWLAAQLDPAAHAQRIQAAQVHGIGLAFASLLDDGIDVRRWKGSDPSADGSSPAPFAELHGRIALAAPSGFASQATPTSAADWWARLLQIPKSFFHLLDDVARRMAFTTAGVNDVTMLVEVHELGQRAATEGWSRQRFRDELANLYRRNGLDPTADWHADLVYTNNIRQANGAVRYAQTVDNPASHRLIPYLGWATFGDDRVRARPLHNHAVMADRIFATGHAIWQTWWYPAGHACRCLVFTINRPKAERMGLVGAEPTGPWPITESGKALPDPGFRGSPSMQQVVLTNEDNLDAVTGAADSAPDLLEAIATILRLLGLKGFGGHR